MRKSIFFTAISLLTGIFAFAQTGGKISGTVADESGKVLAAATVSLLKANDSGLVKVAITDK
ncbi:MAG: carboxypeptidase-like regulatory domain-containing protein, partial [Bacteroidota bacterium]|nr:carboxypeptidase-like regulatory domain-containing protein [Bacteroidota bacterium]